MTHGIVLIEAERSALHALRWRVGGLDGVAETYSITGDWDFVASSGSRPRSGLPSVTGEIARLDGVTKTHTMVAFQAFSRYDLEAISSVFGVSHQLSEHLKLALGAPHGPNRPILRSNSRTAGAALAL